MTSKLFLYLGAGLLVVFAGRAQDRRTIQISEVDTVLLNPTAIEYLVSVNKNSDIMEMGQPKKAIGAASETPASMAAVRNLLRDHHIAWTPGTQRGYAIGQFRAVPDSGIVLTVHSEEELNSVYMLLVPFSGLSAKIGQITYEQMPSRVSIYKTLYQRALSDVLAMAAISGKVLGDLIAVEEPQDPLWSVRQMTEGLQTSFNWVADLTGGERGKLQKREQIKMLFKFELK